MLEGRKGQTSDYFIAMSVKFLWKELMKLLRAERKYLQLGEVSNILLFTCSGSYLQLC